MVILLILIVIFAILVIFFKYLKLVILLDSSMTSVMGSSVTISNLKHEIRFIKSDKTCES